MRMIRLFYKPFEIFGELKDARWMPAFVTCVALSLLSNLILLRAIGVPVVLARTPIWATKAGGSAIFTGLYLARTLQMIVGLLVMALLIWLALRIVLKRSETQPEAAFGVTFAVCSYAACAREAVRFIIWSGAVVWHYVVRVPLIETQQIKTNLAAVLELEPDGRLCALAKAIDVLTFLFLALVTVGLWKVTSHLRPRQAAAVVISSWIMYLGLAVLWGR